MPTSHPIPLQCQILSMGCIYSELDNDLIFILAYIVKSEISVYSHKAWYSITDSKDVNHCCLNAKIYLQVSIPRSRRSRSRSRDRSRDRSRSRSPRKGGDDFKEADSYDARNDETDAVRRD